MNKHCLSLCLVTDGNDRSLIQHAIAGGITALQLRNKNISQAELLLLAHQLKALLEPHHIPLIINDHITIAKAVDAAGVHLGQSDGQPEQARELLGADKLIGVSIESLAELDKANQQTSISYVAASAVFASTSKADCKTIWGIEGLRSIVKQSIHPVMAIGGINLTNIQQVMHCGVSGVAVISAIHQAENPALATKLLRHEITNYV